LDKRPVRRKAATQNKRIHTPNIHAFSGTVHALDRAATVNGIRSYIASENKEKVEGGMNRKCNTINGKLRLLENKQAKINNKYCGALCPCGSNHTSFGGLIYF
jgi:hypothetical protein